jgi:outer membrane protein TolC
MSFQPGKARTLWGSAAGVFVCWGILLGSADGQPPPKGGLSLKECVDLGLQMQPALTAAQASVDAAQSGYQAAANLRLLGRVSKVVKIRRNQACWGITIAEAGLLQAEWETRYAVTRNYFSMIHARNQLTVVDSVLDKLKQNRDNAKRIVDAGDPKSKVTQIDVDTLDVQIAFFEARRAEATVGTERARSALREAIGLGQDEPLDIDPRAQLPAPVYNLDRKQMIAWALERRGEMVQASSAEQVTALEVDAQQASRKLSVKTFAGGGDVHAKPIPQGVSNNEYRPGAIGIEMPVFMEGKKRDRVQRAEDFNTRAVAVVDKTQKLITLEVEASYYKWQEALEQVQRLDKTLPLTRKIANDVTRRFNDKKASGEEMIKARTLEDQAQSKYNEALYNHALGLAALERVTAGGYRPTYAAKSQP